LISNNDLDHIVERHILPCLLLNYNIEINRTVDLLDIGSGAGFPGLVLKIMQPDLKVVLVDSMRKKCLFLREASENLKIECNIICQRAEHYNQNHADKFDIIVNRAVTSLNVLWSWAQPLLKEGGFFYAMKGGDCRDEIATISMNKIVPEIVYPSDNWIDFSRFLNGKTIIIIENPLF
jgi:16S rRNA (guanine527-N7)-methyltransferase